MILLSELGEATGQWSPFHPFQVAKMTGVTPEIIRTWRNRGFLPARRDNLTFADVARIYLISELVSGGLDLATAASAAERGCRTVAFFALRHCFGTINIIGSDESAALILKILRDDPDQVILNCMGQDAPEEDEDIGHFMIKPMGEDCWKITSVILDLKQVTGGSGVFVDLEEAAKTLVRQSLVLGDDKSCLMTISDTSGIEMGRYICLQVGYAGPERDLIAGKADVPVAA